MKERNRLEAAIAGYRRLESDLNDNRELVEMAAAARR